MSLKLTDLPSPFPKLMEYPMIPKELSNDPPWKRFEVHIVAGPDPAQEEPGEEAPEDEEEDEAEEGTNE